MITKRACVDWSKYLPNSHHGLTPDRGARVEAKLFFVIIIFEGIGHILCVQPGSGHFPPAVETEVEGVGPQICTVLGRRDRPFSPVPPVKGLLLAQTFG